MQSQTEELLYIHGTDWQQLALQWLALLYFLLSYLSTYGVNPKSNTAAASSVIGWANVLGLFKMWIEYLNISTALNLLLLFFF